MSRTTRGLSTGACAVLACAAIAAPAAALSSSTNPIRGTAGSVTLRIQPVTTRTPIDVVCASSAITWSVTNTASGVTTAPTGVALGDASFATCTLAGSSLAVTQTAAWTGTLTAATSGGAVIGYGTDLVIPARGLSVRTAAGCQFTVSGSRASDAVNANPFTQVPFTSTTMPLAIDATNGSFACVASGFAVGAPFTIIGTYSVPTTTLSL